MTVKKLWIAALLAMLLVMGLAGEAGARERTAVSAWKYVTVSAAHFHPPEEGLDWYNYGRGIHLVSGGGGDLIADVVFPGSGPVTVKKVILYAYDFTSSFNVSVQLFKTNPLTGGETAMALAESSGASTTDAREFSDTTITYATIQRTHGAYLRLHFDASGNSLQVYGVKIAYVD